MKKILLTLGVASILIFSSASSFAGSCIAGNLKNKLWTLYVTNEYNQEFNDGDDIFYNAVQRCTFKVLGNGYVRLNDKCYNPSGQYFAYVSGGRLNINKQCRVSGNIYIEHNGGTIRIRFMHALMDIGKTIVNGQVLVYNTSEVDTASSPVQMVRH